MEPVNKQVGASPGQLPPSPGPTTPLTANRSYGLREISTVNHSTVNHSTTYLSNKSPANHSNHFRVPKLPSAPRRRVSHPHGKLLSIDIIPLVLTLADTGTYNSAARQLSTHAQMVKNARLMVENYYCQPLFTLHTTTLPTSTNSSRIRVKPSNPNYIPKKAYNRLILTDFGKSIIPVLRQIHELNIGIWQGIVSGNPNPK